jgi:hypothetical protein
MRAQSAQAVRIGQEVVGERHRVVYYALASHGRVSCRFNRF